MACLTFFHCWYVWYHFFLFQSPQQRFSNMMATASNIVDRITVLSIGAKDRRSWINTYLPEYAPRGDPLCKLQFFFLSKGVGVIYIAHRPSGRFWFFQLTIFMHRLTLIRGFSLFTIETYLSHLLAKDCFDM